MFMKKNLLLKKISRQVPSGFEYKIFSYRVKWVEKEIPSTQNESLHKDLGYKYFSFFQRSIKNKVKAYWN